MDISESVSKREDAELYHDQTSTTRKDNKHYQSQFIPRIKPSNILISSKVKTYFANEDCQDCQGILKSRRTEWKL